ncbi:TetR/AcrR family transcriptional regulator [Shewanella submarina]|uniref:TetR/AcrR family transcriptional regulator n=1 Tax=Shewanella submarina TaxID=2016376 RepID=A0ABV7GK83_9GAMM|nr:TetR/AcrR family transcriptional regulator [Shewanella submarina]MCL1036381.1 TetR/AcrR family transcriptional regulator [Shewanella submarina]
MKLSEIKHLDILDAAEKEFLELGFDGTSMDAISARASVSKRTLYRHFESKEALFSAVLSRLHQRNHTQGFKEYDKNQSLHDQLLALLNDELKLHSDTYSLPVLRMIVVELLRQPEMARQLLTEIYAGDNSFLLWLQQAGQAGALNNHDYPQMARLLKGMFSGLVIWPGLLTGDALSSGEETNQLLQEIANVFCRAYGATQG